MATEANVYQSPQADVTPQIDEQALELATTGQRFLNWVLDTVFLYVFSMVFGAVLAIVLVMTVGEAGLDIFHNRALTWGIGIVLAVIYYVVQEKTWGRTLGKLITRTRVLNDDGSPLTMGRAIGRALCRYIPFEIFSFLGGDGQPRGWHDSIPKTMVVRTKPL